MLSRRRTTAAAALAGAVLALTACGGGDSTGGSSPSSSSSSSSSSSATSPSTSPTSGSTTAPAEATPSTDPHEIDCSVIPQAEIDRWTRGGAPATLDSTDDGCRVISSSEDGAVIVKWRFLDVIGSNDDAKTLRDHAKTSTPVTVAPGVRGTRAETDVAPTRTARVIARAGHRTVYVETTVTLDRQQSLQDMRRIAKGVVVAYEKA